MPSPPEVLTPVEVAAALEAAMATLRAELGALPERVLGWHPAADEWCAKEVVGHLIEAERRGFAGRIRIILAGNEPALETWDQVEVARARRDCERAYEDAHTAADTAAVDQRRPILGQSADTLTCGSFRRAGQLN